MGITDGGVGALRIHEFVGINDGVFNNLLGGVMDRVTSRILGCHHGDSGSLQLPSNGAGNEALPALFFHPEVAFPCLGGREFR
jgi:hypothetical protein